MADYDEIFRRMRRNDTLYLGSVIVGLLACAFISTMGLMHFYVGGPMKTETMLLLLDVLKWVAIIGGVASFVMISGVIVSYWWDHLSEEGKKMVLKAMEINFLSSGFHG